MKYCLMLLLTIVVSPAMSATFEEGVELLRRGYFTKAKALFLELRQEKNAKGALGLGLMYQFAYAEASANYPKAMTYYIEAANENIPEAIHNVGYLYEAGLGVEKNLPEAAKWYNRSANLGFATSQHDLGIMYYHGRGVDKDYAKAFSLFKQGAEAGLAPSYYCLGLMYTYGLGTRKDYRLAFAYLNSAKKLGEVVKPEELKKIELQLSATELTKANALSATLVSGARKPPSLL